MSRCRPQNLENLVSQKKPKGIFPALCAGNTFFLVKTPILSRISPIFREGIAPKSCSGASAMFTNAESAEVGSDNAGEPEGALPEGALVASPEGHRSCASDEVAPEMRQTYPSLQVVGVPGTAVLRTPLGNGIRPRHLRVGVSAVANDSTPTRAHRGI